MPADSEAHKAIERQAIDALAYLSPADKHKVLQYIDSLMLLEKVQNDQRSTT